MTRNNGCTSLRGKLVKEICEWAEKVTDDMDKDMVRVQTKQNKQTTTQYIDSSTLGFQIVKVNILRVRMMVSSMRRSRDVSMGSRRNNEKQLIFMAGLRTRGLSARRRWKWIA
ncbi:hypothetical protein FHG87_022457 [Trinorchestia longiramus]|nr:hypothetical protein FHG87_022457 [Trinorchestia longiramus]